jgi:hypothetical protein
MAKNNDRSDAPEPSLLWLAIEAREWMIVERLLDSGLQFDFAERAPRGADEAETLLSVLLRGTSVSSYTRRKPTTSVEAIGLRLLRAGAPFLPDALPVVDRHGWAPVRGAAMSAFRDGAWAFLDPAIEEGLIDSKRLLEHLLAEAPRLLAAVLEKDDAPAAERLLRWGMDANGQDPRGGHWVAQARGPEVLAVFTAAGARLAEAVDDRGRALPERFSSISEARKRTAMLDLVLRAAKEAQGNGPKALERKKLRMPGEAADESAPAPAALERVHETLLAVAKTGRAGALKRACELVGADPVAYRTPTGMSLLSASLLARHFANARWLVGKGAKIMEPDTDGCAPLFFALWAQLAHSSRGRGAAQRRADFLADLPKLCAAEGFDWSARDERGRTLLMRGLDEDLAATRKRSLSLYVDSPFDYDTIRFLEKNGSPFDAVDRDGRGTLRVARDGGIESSLCSLLFRMGSVDTGLDQTGVPLIVDVVARDDMEIGAVYRHLTPQRIEQTQGAKALAFWRDRQAGKEPFAWPERDASGRSVGAAAVAIIAESVDARQRRSSSHSMSRSEERRDTPDCDGALQMRLLLGAGMPALAAGDDGRALWDAWAEWLFPTQAAGGREAPVSVLAPREERSGLGADSLLLVAEAQGDACFDWALGSLVARGFALRGFDKQSRNAWARDGVEERLLRLPASHPLLNASGLAGARERLERERPGLLAQIERQALSRDTPDGAKVSAPRPAARL